MVGYDESHMTAFSRLAVLVAACWAASGQTDSGEVHKPVVPGTDWERVANSGCEVLGADTDLDSGVRVKDGGRTTAFAGRASGAGAGFGIRAGVVAETEPPGPDPPAR